MKEVTTITVDVSLSGGIIDIVTLFYMVPVCREFRDEKGNIIPIEAQEGKMPPQNGTDKILSARYDGMTRGWRRDGWFLNHIICNFLIWNKNVTVKVSSKKFYITGCNSQIIIEETSKKMIKLIEDTHRELLYLQSKAEESSALLDHIYKTLVRDGKFDFSLLKESQTHSFDSKLADILYDLTNDYVFWNQYISIIFRLFSTRPIISFEDDDKLSLLRMDIKMMNRMSKLDFQIHLTNVCLCLIHFDRHMCRHIKSFLPSEISLQSKALIPEATKESRHDLAFLLLASAAYAENFTVFEKYEKALSKIKIDFDSWKKNFELKYGYFPEIRLLIDFHNAIHSNIRIVAFNFAPNGAVVHHTFTIQSSRSVKQSSNTDFCVIAIKAFFDEFIELYKEYLPITSPSLYPIL